MGNFSSDSKRLAIFLTIFVVMAVVERLWPRRERIAVVTPRWTANFVLMALGAVLTRALFPAAAVGAALWADARGFGLLNHLDWPHPIKTVLAVASLDLVIYWQHRLFHRIPWLWRLHAVHHTDLDLDASSGVRFHPFEIALSMCVKVATVAALGISPIATVLFEVLLNATSVFNHANAALPPAADRLLRLLVVTPDMHRVHHTTEREEQDSNFGFNLPWWDRLFGTYRAQPRNGHVDARLGLAEERDPEALRVTALLLRPFRKA